MSGSNRSWGYASYDMDDENNANLTYTSYEKSGGVNRYTDNGNGGHGHSNWKDADDYNLGRDSDYSRTESNSSSNPSTGEVQDNGGCYLTTACMKHYMDEFDDNCYYLDILRWFRDKFVSLEDKKEYYEIAPKVVEVLNNLPNANEIYNEIYYKVIQVCVWLIEEDKFDEAYKIYKENVIELDNKYVKKLILN